MIYVAMFDEVAPESTLAGEGNFGGFADPKKQFSGNLELRLSLALSLAG